MKQKGFPFSFYTDVMMLFTVVTYHVLGNARIVLLPTQNIHSAIKTYSE